MDSDEYGFESSDDDTTVCISHHYSSGSDSGDEDAVNQLLEYAKPGCWPSGLGSDSADLFEEEMASELDRTMQRMKAFGGTGPSSDGSQLRQQYDKVYFDSDEDEDDEGVQRQRATLSDAELFYDPAEDDRDQRWMDDHRGTGTTPNNSKRSQKSGLPAALPQSDAVLNCPGCLTMLCADCQRHESYGHQYRAMFVFSCRVDYTQHLACPPKLSKKEVWKNKKKQRQLKRKQMMEEEEDQHLTLRDNPAQTKRPKRERHEETEIEIGDVMPNSGLSMASKNESNGVVKEESLLCGSADRSDTSEVMDETSLTTKVSAIQISNNTDQVENMDSGQSKTLRSSLKRTNSSHAPGSSPLKKVRFLSDSEIADDRNRFDGKEDLSKEDHQKGSILTERATLNPDEEVFYPVMCQHCNTKVAVMDKDEVYHFYNVVTSY